MPKRFLAVTTFLIAFSISAPSQTFGIFDPVAYAPYENLAVSLRAAIRDYFGIHASGSDYATRKAIADAMDGFMAWQVDPAGTTIYHPFLYPESTCFMRSFLNESLKQMIAEMDADALAPQAIGMKIWYTSENGTLIQVMLPTGPGGALQPFRIMFDFSDLVMTFSQQLSPGCIGSSEFSTIVQDIAQRINLYSSSHEHPDHWSLQLLTAMQALGKPCVMTPTMVALTAIHGYSTANFYSIPTGVYPLAPGISLGVFNGAQIIQFTGDPAPTYIQNNVVFISFDIPVDGSPNDGVTFMHSGDNNDPGIAAFLATATSAGAIKPHVVVANGLASLGAGSVDLTIGSPVFEVTHPAGANLFMNMPPEGGLNPAAWMPLFWGESIRYPLDLPL